MILSFEELHAAILLALALLGSASIPLLGRGPRDGAAAPGWWSLVWSALTALRQHSHQGGWRPVLRMGWFCLAHARLAGQWLRFLDTPPLRALVRWQPRLLDKIQRPYVNRHWRAEQRVHALMYHYRWMLARWQLGAIMNVYTHRPIELARIKGRGGPTVSLWLEHASAQEREGELSLAMRATYAGAPDGGPRVAILAFSIAEEDGHPYLAIGSVQGTKRASLETFRELTKCMHGLRPKALLVWAAQACAEQWALPARGISSQAHPFTCLRYRTSRRKRAALKHMDQTYGPLWRESGGVMAGGGWYALPGRATIRPREQVPSDKRGLYDRRGALQRELVRQLSESLHGLDSGGFSAARASA